MRKLTLFTVLAALSFSPSLWSQEVDETAPETESTEVEVTETDMDDALEGVELDVVAEGEGPSGMLRRIELPAQASDEARTNSAAGLERANAAREGREAFGAQVSEEARETRGRPESAGRPDDAGRPEDADRPDEAPENPGRPGGAGRPGG